MSAAPIRRAASLAAISLAVGAGSAGAQPFAGYTTGCFGAACTTATTATLTPGLSFFGAGSVGSPTAFGTALGGALTLTNLGTVTLASTSGATYNSSFTLGLTFTSPGGGSSLFSTVIGTLNNGGQGSVVLNFGGPQLVTYAGGSFLVAVNDATVSPQGSAPGSVLLTGSITNAMATSTVPEPATVVLFGTGALGLVGFAARRRQS